MTNSKDLFDCKSETEAAAWLNAQQLTRTQKREFFASWVIAHKAPKATASQLSPRIETLKRQLLLNLSEKKRAALELELAKLSGNACS